jgi:hypothetical protein
MLSYFCALLLDVVDALYVCYALDRDRREVARPEVHQLFCMLPAAGYPGAAAGAGAGAGSSHPGGLQQHQPYAPPQIVPSFLPDHVVYGVPVVQSPPVHGGPFMLPPPPPTAAAYAAPSAPPKQ